MSLFTSQNYVPHTQLKTSLSVSTRATSLDRQQSCKDLQYEVYMLLLATGYNLMQQIVRAQTFVSFHLLLCVSLYTRVVEAM